MNTEAVIEFLGNVPLLQRLPRSLFKKIAEVVKFKHYEKGDYIVSEGEVGDGIYFVWEGEAKVSGSVHAEEENRLGHRLKQYDYFGHVTSSSVHMADIIALTKLTCLVLPHEHCRLLQSKSIWSADKTPETSAAVESILDLEPTELNMFQGISPPGTEGYQMVFGGQLVGQALAAASKTVDPLKMVQSLHSYFLMFALPDIPIIYQVNRLRDGRSFATRRVDAIQKGNIIFTLLASFQKEEEGFDHQEATMPSVPAPDVLLSMGDLGPTDPRRSYRKTAGAEKFVHLPIDLRFCEPNTIASQTKSDPRLRYWFRAKGRLSDDQALHRCVAAYVSDMWFSFVSLNPHRRKGLTTLASFSLDHSVWFHRRVRADDWLLFAMDSPTTCMNRGFISGQMFNRKGELVLSIAQAALLKITSPPNTAVVSKI